MTYNGHVENGAIVLDEPASLAEGARVKVEIVDAVMDGAGVLSLRGTHYTYCDPFSPAIEPDDWEAAQ